MMIDKHQGTVESLAQFRRSMANRSPVPQQQQQPPSPNRRRRNSLVEGDDGSDSNRLLVVDFSGMCLDFLPSPSVNLAAIYKLDLSNNNLENIPESLVARLLNVVVLDVHSNQLTCLPNSIGCLSKLKILNVSANLLSSIPRTIENCRSLEELNANFNKLIALPETIGFELVNLKKLSVNSNKISLLPYSTSHLTELRILDVRLNSLHALPDDLENLINLQVLNVSQNFHHLSALPYSVGLLLSLSELDISYNRIAALPPSLGCLPELRRLCVEGNPLVSPPIDVVEFGLHAVKKYLTEKMNAGEPSGRQRRTWFGRLKKHPTMNSRVAVEGRRSNPIEAIASPRHILRMLSPRRLFSSPQHSFSRLTSSDLLK